MALTPGTKLGPYEVQSQLGAGGMGEVYLAKDTRLERNVAIKILPESFAAHQDRLERFAQEARVLSALNHPGLLAIYDIGNEQGLHFLVSEYLDGQTLREGLNTATLSRRKVLEYARQLAAALAAAHDRGIVHRDLKPENIFITGDERVKILDFGLAKQSRGEADLTGVTATLATPATAPGTVMGTVGYMSPEQVRGGAVDHRSDIFSFGAIAYEMVSGKRAFQHASGIETMHAILNDDPPELNFEELKISPGAERIIRHCLEKNPGDRFQSARDLGFALGALSGTGTSQILAAAAPEKPSRQWLSYFAATAAALAVAAILALVLRKAPPDAARLEFAIPVNAEVSHLAISADGRMLAMVAPEDTTGENVVTIQRVGAPGATILAGTEGASYPFWSPDDAFLAFFADGKLKKIPVAGGPAQILTLAPNARGGSWGSRNVIIYAGDAGGPLRRINPDGGNPGLVTDKVFDAANESSHRWPFFLPDGEHFLFWAGNFGNVNNDQRSGIFLSSLAGTKRTKLLVGHSNPGYVDGHIVYVDENKTLVTAPLDVSGEKLTGEPTPLASGIGYQPSVLYGSFAAAANGTVVYSTGAGSALSNLTWYDRSGRNLGLVGEPGVLANPRISPNGNFAAVDRTDVKANNIDIWIQDLQHGTASRFTFDPAEEVSGTWSRDGRNVAYRSTAGNMSVWEKSAEGLEREKALFESSTIGEIIPTSWSLDGQSLFCTVQPDGGVSRLAVLPVAGGGPGTFLASSASITSGQISSDGKYVAYASNESGDWEIYVTTFPGAAGKWQISRGGGREVRWNRNSQELFYIGARNMLNAVSVNTTSNLTSGTPVALFQVRSRAQISSTDLYSYDVAPDGARFLVNSYVKPAYIRPLMVILNASAAAQK